jgi:LSD1 subclass zinc finger protein
MRASTEAKSLGGSRLIPKGTRWESVGTSWSMGGDEVASGADCTVVSGTRVTPSKSFASVLASSVCLELACCGEMALVFVSDARLMPDVPPVGASAPSTRSTADEVPPPAWRWLPRLLLRRWGRGRDKLECRSSATWGRCRRFRRRRASCRQPLSLSRGEEGVSCRSCR